MQEQNNLSRLDQAKQEQEIRAKDQISCNKFSFLFPLILGFIACLGVYYYLDKNLIIIFCFTLLSTIFSREYWKRSTDKKYSEEAKKREKTIINKPYSENPAIGLGWPWLLSFISIIAFCISLYWVFTKKLTPEFLLLPFLFLLYGITGVLINLTSSRLDYFIGKKLFMSWFIIPFISLLIAHYSLSLSLGVFVLYFTIILIIFFLIRKKHKNY